MYSMSSVDLEENHGPELKVSQRSRRTQDFSYLKKGQTQESSKETSSCRAEDAVDYL